MYHFCDVIAMKKLITLGVFWTSGNSCYESLKMIYEFDLQKAKEYEKVSENEKKDDKIMNYGNIKNMILPMEKA